MNRKETGEFLYRFYQKRTASFLLNIYKASITGDSRDIHRARLDVKKIIALFGLFELLDPAAFGQQPGYGLFRPLFRKAGKIREIQVNAALLAELDPRGADHPLFQSWLREEEQVAVQQFLRSVKKFREQELKKTNKIVEKICFSGSKFNLRYKTEDFIKNKIKLIKKLQSGETGDREIHKIRQHLKTISTLTTLVYAIKPGRHLDLVISALNKTEMMIGDWHDRLVLIETVNRYRKGNASIKKEELASLDRLKKELTNYNSNLAQHFMPEVTAIVQAVLQKDG